MASLGLVYPELVYGVQAHVIQRIRSAKIFRITKTYQFLRSLTPRLADKVLLCLLQYSPPLLCATTLWSPFALHEHDVFKVSPSFSLLNYYLTHEFPSNVSISLLNNYYTMFRKIIYYLQVSFYSLLLFFVILCPKTSFP